MALGLGTNQIAPARYGPAPVTDLADAMPVPVAEQVFPFAHAVEGVHDRTPLCTPGQTDPALTALLLEACPLAELDMLSMDVFDTVLLRNAKPETLRFAEIAEQQAAAASAAGHPVGARTLLLARLEAAHLAYRARPAVDGHREGHIDDIMKIQCRMADLPEALAPLLKTVELAYEAENLAPNGLFLDLAEQFKAAGKPVILISDMYLDSAAIAGLVATVTRRGKLFDRVFSSAEAGASKRSGGLYGKVAKQMGIAPERILHIGDSLPGDVRQARNAGWRALHFPIARAEKAARTSALAAFLAQMRDADCDVARWAQL